MRPPRPCIAVLCAAAALLLPACAARPDDPAFVFLSRTLRPGERMLELRVLDPPDAARIAAVIDTAGGRPELRIYERGPGGAWARVVSESEGDQFGNLSVEDVDGDGRDEVLVSWLGGHLEILEVMARGDDGSWKTVFQNAGRSIERRYGETGTLEFWITSRTYEESPGEPPAYATTIYRWAGDGFAEINKR